MLEINFYNGEFISEDNYVFTVFISISSIVITMLLQRIYDNYKENCYLDDLYQHTKNQISNLTTSAHKQSSSLVSLSKTLKDSKVSDFSLNRISDFNVKGIKDWDTIDFYKSILQRKKGNNLTLLEKHDKIKRALTFLQKLEESIENDFVELNIKYQSTQKDWKYYVQSIGDLLDYFRLNYNKGDVFFEEYARIVFEWNNSNESNSKREMSYVHDNLVIHLKELCKQYPKDLRAYELQRLALRLSGIYSEMVHLKYRYRRISILNARKLITASIHLNKNIQEIGDLKTKSKFKL